MLILSCWRYTKLEKCAFDNHWSWVFGSLSSTEGFPGGASGKEPACQCRGWKRPRFDMDWEDPLEEGMATCSRILAWRIPTDWGVWWATVHRVAKSWIWLKWLSTAHARPSTEASYGTFSRSMSPSGPTKFCYVLDLMVCGYVTEGVYHIALHKVFSHLKESHNLSSVMKYCWLNDPIRYSLGPLFNI